MKFGLKLGMDKFVDPLERDPYSNKLVVQSHCYNLCNSFTDFALNIKMWKIIEDDNRGDFVPPQIKTPS